MTTKAKKVSKDRQILEEQTRKALQGLAISNPEVQNQIINQTIGPPEEDVLSEEDNESPPRVLNSEPSSIPSVSPTVHQPPTLDLNQHSHLGTLTEVSLQDIELSPYQPRVFFDEDSIGGLMESIEQSGLHQPIIVRPVGHGKYELIAGERRLRSFQKLGRETIPAIIRTQTDEESMVAAFGENLQRENFTPFEEAQGYARLVNELGLTQTQLAKRLGISHRRVSHAVSILELPQPTLERLFAPGSEVTMGHAEALLPLSKDPSRLQKVVDKLVTKKLTVKQIRKEVSGERRTHSSFQPVRYHFLGKTQEKGYTLLIQFRPDRPFDHEPIRSALALFQDFLDHKITQTELIQNVQGFNHSSSPSSDSPSSHFSHTE
jgi:ParB/RepB/Spo0J family partition protein